MELGWNKTNNDHEIYQFCDQNNRDKMIKRHSQYLQHDFKPDVTQNSTPISGIYWLPKLRKNSSKARYVIAALR